MPSARPPLVIDPTSPLRRALATGAGAVVLVLPFPALIQAWPPPLSLTLGAALVWTISGALLWYGLLRVHQVLTVSDGRLEVAEGQQRRSYSSDELVHVALHRTAILQEGDQWTISVVGPAGVVAEVGELGAEVQPLLLAQQISLRLKIPFVVD